MRNSWHRRIRKTKLPPCRSAGLCIARVPPLVRAIATPENTQGEGNNVNTCSSTHEPGAALPQSSWKCWRRSLQSGTVQCNRSMGCLNWSNAGNCIKHLIRPLTVNDGAGVGEKEQVGVWTRMAGKRQQQVSGVASRCGCEVCTGAC